MGYNCLSICLPLPLDCKVSPAKAGTDLIMVTIYSPALSIMPDS